MKQGLVSALLLIVLSVSCTPFVPIQAFIATPVSTNTSTPPPLFQMKVMSYNILWGGGVDREFDQNLKDANEYDQFGKDRLPGILAAIKETAPDILGIEEGAGWDRGTPSVIQKVAKELDMNFFLAKGAQSELNVMLLSKFKIIEAESLSSEVGNVGALRVKLMAPDGQPLNVFVVHLDPFSENTRACETDTLAQDMQPYMQQRLIIMGDFNTNQGAWSVKNLRQTGMEPVAVGQFLGIDQIWISSSVKGSTTNRSISFPYEKMNDLSDHFPVGAEIVFFSNPAISLPTYTQVPSTPTLAPAPLISDFITNPKILRVDNLEDACTKPKWNSDWTTEKFGDGVIEVAGEEDWKAGVSRNKDFQEGQGVIVRFKYEKGTEANILFDSGQWKTDAYRRFGINIQGDSVQTDLRQGTTGMGGNKLSGNFNPKIDTWYNLMMVIDKNGKFLEVIWDPNDPTQAIKYGKQLNDTWTNLAWQFNVGANKGSVEFSDFTEISFDKIK